MQLMALWGSQSIQFAWFLTSVEGVKADEIFQIVSSEEPEQMQRNRVPSPATPFLSLASGVVNGQNYAVQVQPGRVDIVVSPVPDPGEEFSLPMIGTEQTLTALLNRVDALAPKLANCIRLAAIANTVEQVPTYEAAARILLDSIGLELNLDGTSDLMFQVNRRKLDGQFAPINRVLRYAVLSVQEMLFQVGGSPNIQPIRKERLAASLVLDINTIPDGTVLEVSSQKSIFVEIVGEILRLGADRSVHALDG